MVKKSGARWFWAVVMLIELNKQLKEWCYIDNNFLGNKVTGRVVLDDKFLGYKATGRVALDDTFLGDKATGREVLDDKFLGDKATERVALDDKISGAINFLWRAPREHNKAVIINIITQPGTMTTTS